MTACSREVHKAAARAISAPNTFNQPRRGDLNLAQDAVLGIRQVWTGELSKLARKSAC